jgi:signal transduction histidine kinase
MTDDERIADLRHALANPLSAILAEAQLLLMGDAPLDAETRNGLQEVEKLALRMRAILKATRMITTQPASPTVEEGQ